MRKKPKELNGLLIYSGLSTMKRGGASGISVRGSRISVLDLKLQAKASLCADARSLSWSQTKPSRCFRLFSSLASVTFFVLASLARAESPRACGFPLNSARIVFDSNRSGSFGIYSASLDGTDIRSIVDTPADEVHPEVSPDGRFIIFATHPRTDVKKGMKQGSIWIVGSDGTNLRQIVARGNFPTFGNGGREIVFERNRRKVFTANLDGSKEAEIFPGARDFPFEVVMPRLSPDGESIAFTSDKGGKWNSWIAELATGKVTLIGRGCEPIWYQRSEAVAWVAAKGTLGGSGIFSLHRAKRLRSELFDGAHPFGHEYFPSLALNDTVLLYAAAPEGQHDHATSNYQLFVRHLPTGCVFRPLSDGFTNRWPKWLAHSAPAGSVQAPTAVSATAP